MVESSIKKPGLFDFRNLLYLTSVPYSDFIGFSEVLALVNFVGNKN